MVEEILKSKLVNFLVPDARVDYDTVSDLYDQAGSVGAGQKRCAMLALSLA